VSDEIALTVLGEKYGGWESVEVTRGLESVSGAFSLSVSERWANQSKPWRINDGEACSVRLGDEKLITGFVDRRNIAFDANSHTMTVKGRDRTADLVDCDILLKSSEFKSLALDKFVTKLCEPHHVTVSVQSGLNIPKAPPKMRIEPGAKVFETIEHACRLAGLFAVSDAKGGLLLTRAGSDRAATDLVEGGNILSASSRFDQTQRFARYVVIGQRDGVDGDFGESVSRIKAEAEDSNVRSNRVLIVRPEGNVTSDVAKIRARWESSVRAARAGEITVTVQGWKQGNGKVWPINALVRVKSPSLRINGDLLITKVTMRTGSSGTTTQLELKRPDAFKPEVPKADNTWHEISRGV
jgi:prophage tail gpP-like protein